MPSGGYEVDHGTPIVGVAPDGSAPLVWQEGTSSAELAEDLQKYLAQGGVGRRPMRASPAAGLGDPQPR